MCVHAFDLLLITDYDKMGTEARGVHFHQARLTRGHGKTKNAVKPHDGFAEKSSLRSNEKSLALLNTNHLLLMIEFWHLNTRLLTGLPEV
jgi:hypothetical protein